MALYFWNDNSLYNTWLGDLTLLPYRRVITYWQATQYLLHLSAQRQKFPTLYYIELANNIINQLFFLLLSIAWLVLLAFTSILELAQQTLIQLPYELHYLQEDKLCYKKHLRNLDEVQRRHISERQALIEELLNIPPEQHDTTKTIDLLNQIIQARKNNTPSLTQYIAERDDIYYHMQQLVKNRLKANYMQRPWHQPDLLNHLNHLFIRCMINLDDALRLIELSYLDKGQQLTALNIATSVTQQAEAEHKFFPCDSFFYAIMNFLLSVPEDVTPLTRLQSHYLSLFGLPDQPAYTTKDLTHHHYWIQLYNHFIEQGINQYYQQDGKPFKDLLPDARHQRYYATVDPNTFNFSNEQMKPRELIPPHVHGHKNKCFQFACQIFKLDPQRQMPTREFSRESNYLLSV